MSGPTLSLLFVGDVVGRGGRNAVRRLVPRLTRRFGCGFVVVNAENAAGGAGVTASCLKEMDCVDVFTGGDHTWDQKGFEQEILSCRNFVRPANFSSAQPGVGWVVRRNPVGGEVAVVSLVGKVFMKDSAYCPFETAENVLKKIPPACKCIVVDFHAEATSEKIAMGRFLDGRVTAVLGTHTHVQTADARILPGGTAYLTDVGMTGGHDSVLGREIDAVVRKFRTGMPTRFPVVETGVRMDAAVVRYDMNTGKATEIVALSEFDTGE